MLRLVGPRDPSEIDLNIILAPGIMLWGDWWWQGIGPDSMGSPVDIAGFQVDTGDCVLVREPVAHGYDDDFWGDLSDTQPTLRDGGVGTQSPVWNIPATKTSGSLITHQNKTGTVRAEFDPVECWPIPDFRAQFTYEANRGGSVVGVSVGWGIFDVSYSGSPDVAWQRSTEIVSAWD